MFKRSSKRTFPKAQAADGVHALTHGAEDAAGRVSDAVEVAGARAVKGAGAAGARVAKSAGTVTARAAKEAGKGSARITNGASLASDKAGVLTDKAGALTDKAGVLGGRVSNEITRAQLGARETKRSAKQSLTGKRARMAVRRKRVGSDAMLKAQLVKTSRDLSHESSDLREAVDSLNAVIKANRKSAAASRTRLLGGLAIGAVVTYHLDAEHGKERRAATAERISNLVGTR